MTQHCHETVKKALMWATEAATPHTTLLFIHLHHSSSYSHALFLPSTHSLFKAAWTHGCRSRRCLLHVPGNPKPDAVPALAPSARPKQELQVWTSLTPSPALLLHSRGKTRHIWAATASLLQRVVEMEGEDSDSLYHFGLHPFLAHGVPSAALCAASWHGNINISLSEAVCKPAPLPFNYPQLIKFR